MENIEINIGDKTFTFIPPPPLSPEEIEDLYVPSSPSLSTIPFPGPSTGSGTSLWSHSLVSVTPLGPPTGGLHYIDYTYDMPEQLITYSKDEELNKILNDMADEVEGKVKEKRTFSIPAGTTGTAVVDPYDFSVRTYTSTGASPFTTTTPSSWKIY